MTIFTRNGEIWETRGATTYGYYQDRPCQIIEMRGDIVTYMAPDTFILHREPLDGEWSRYYLDSHDPDFHNNTVKLAQILNHH